MTPSVPDRKIPPPFAERLAAWLEANDKTQDDLAFKARDYGAESMTGSYVSKLKRGVKRPSAGTIAALAAAMGESAEDFPEYHLALARRELDERPPAEGGAGREHAIQTLLRIQRALAASATAGGSKSFPATPAEAEAEIGLPAALGQKAPASPRRTRQRRRSS